jgi:hypothetical protein
MYISRNLELALLALHSWKSFVSNWMQAAVALLDVKDSSKSIKASKAANDIFKVQFISLAPTVFPVSYNTGELAYHYYTRMKITSTSAMETLETIHIRMYFIMHLPYVYYLGQKGLQHNCWNLIKCPLVPSMSPGFYSRIGRGEPSNMVLESRSWVQSPLAMHFPLCVIPSSLARSPYGGALHSTYMTRAHSCVSHVLENYLVLVLETAGPPPA